LGDRLGVEKLLARIGDRLVISSRDRALAETARKVLSAYDEVRAASDTSLRSVILRFAAYPAHLKRFAAQALGEIEHEFPNLRVELQDLEGRRRRGGGLTSTTQLRERAVDMVIAVCNFDERVPTGLEAKDLYGWRLMAVVGPDDPLSSQRPKSLRRSRTLDVRELRGRRLLVAPKGHRSRDLLDLFANADPPWEVVGESEDPEVLASIASYSDRVAVIPTDSLPAIEDIWPILMAPSHGELGGKYRVLWRSSDSDPDRLRVVMSALAERLHTLSAPLRLQSGGSLTSPTADSKQPRPGSP